MKTWTVALLATLGVFAADGRADEPAKRLPVTATPEVLPAPVDHPAIIAPTAPSCGGDCNAQRRSCSHSGRIWAWLTYHPESTGCDICYTKTRPTHLYAYFMCYPCQEGSGAACGRPACGSCASGCAQH
jgi:hypothetical protein